MPRYRRSRAEGATFFFTVNSFRRQPLLILDPVRAALRQALKDVHLQMPFQIHAWVLLPDHLHCIWELPSGDADFSKRWGIIKRQVTQICGSELDRLPQQSASQSRRNEATLWQRRFWEHQIRDDEDFARHADYIHWNPVKHGYVARVIDWPYSTFHRYVREGLYAADWGGDARDELAGDFGE